MVSVVRDYDMYRSCVKDNPFLSGCRMVDFDNRNENVSVTERYNGFLDSEMKDEWIVFCHEDWEALEPLAPLVEKLDPDYLYGPVGVFVEEKKGRADVIVMKGEVVQSGKKGGRHIMIRGKDSEGRVDTFDCQCLIVHSSLVRRNHLRFDTHLSFDMYVEDFCVSAYEKAGIESMAVRIACHHHSPGSMSKSFFEALDYVREKWSVSRKRYATIVGHLNTFGGDPSRKVYKWKRIPHIMLRYKFSK